MAELRPLPFPDLVRRMRREVQASGAIFDLPVRKWWIPDEEFDFSATHFGRRASTPVGPAAGPHTQLAQNIVLSWLAGGRIIELKTVQVNDRLDIPRPCIHVPNVGYNVEWSQELRVRESLVEYAKAAYLIAILKHTRAFGALPGRGGTDTVFDISVGYDLEGIRSEKVTGFVQGLKFPQPIFRELRSQLQGDLAVFRDVLLPESISHCVTLSTFHGCPADQIEAIARHLIEELELHTIIKLNPTLLGFEAVREILVDRLGYEHLTLRREAFDVDLQYDDGIEILRRLRDVAESAGSAIGAKFTNTLVVENDPGIFPTQTDPYMYVSGPPLHVISMNLMQRVREDLGFELPVSFSAGIDARNFASAVACGMVPVTTCTDLLRQGGFGRLPAYLRSLGRAMKERGVTSREAFVLAATRRGGQAVADALRSYPDAGAISVDEMRRLELMASTRPEEALRQLRSAAQAAGFSGDGLVLHATRVAGRLNGRDLVPTLANDPRYRAAANAKGPKRIESTLSLYDCINCDLCISACPNDAVFAYAAAPMDVATDAISVGEDGRLQRAPGRGFRVRTSHQLAVLEGACNECSNCEVYCPEDGAPFRVKERLFLDRERFLESRDDGFCRVGSSLLARVQGREFRLDVAADGARATLHWDGVTLDVAWGGGAEILGVVAGPGYTRWPGERTGSVSSSIRTGSLDIADLWRAWTAWHAIYQSVAPNPLCPDPPAERVGGRRGGRGATDPEGGGDARTARHEPTGSGGAAPAGPAGDMPTGSAGEAPTGSAGEAPEGFAGKASTESAGEAPEGFAGEPPTGSAGEMPTGSAGEAVAGAEEEAAAGPLDGLLNGPGARPDP